MCLAVLREVEVRGPEAEDHHEEADNLERVCGFPESVEHDQTALSRHTGSRANCDRRDHEEQQANEATRALGPRKSHVRVVEEICQDNGVNDAPNRGAGRCVSHCHGSLFEEVVTNDSEGWRKDKPTGETEKDPLTERELIVLSTKAREHHGNDERRKENGQMTACAMSVQMLLC